MKSTKILTLTLLLFILSATLEAQRTFADTLIIQIDENVQLLAAMENGHNLDSAVNVDRIYRALETEIPGIISQSDLDEVNIRIEYVQLEKAAEISWTSEQKRYGLHIDSTGKTTRILLNKDSIYMGIGPEIHVTLIFDDISDRSALEKANLDELLWNARKKLVGDINKHTPFSSTFSVGENGKDVERIEFDSRNGDQIELKASIGMGLIRHDITPRINATIGIDFINKRSQLHNKLRLNASFNYSFRSKPEGGTSMYINTFIGVDYAHNFSSKEESLYGIGIHYLVGQNGPIFEGETWN